MASRFRNPGQNRQASDEAGQPRTAPVGPVGSVQGMISESGPADEGSPRWFTAEDTARTLEHAGRLSGVDVSDARLIRIGENAIYRLPGGAIARIARSQKYAPDARKEVAVARWLEKEGFPAVRALSIDQPLETDGRVVTFWKAIQDEESYGSPAEVASLLLRLHHLEAPATLGLPPLKPFARAELRIDGNGWLSAEDDDFLRKRLGELQSEYARLSFDLPPGVIHGDASVGNVIHDRDGNPVMIDLDGFSVGPREWDLVLTALYYERFGWHTHEEYDDFVRVYGVDVMVWEGYSVLRDIREFLMVTWLSQKGHDDEEAAQEVRMRIATLRNGGDRRDWKPY